jgi:transposase
MTPEKDAFCHTCDFKPCVRGSHLFKGTHAENAADMKQKGRSAVGDKNGMRRQPHRTSPGEKNGYAKLTDEQVREICRAYDATEASQYELARRFGVWQMTVSRIVRRISRQTAHI